MIRAGNGRFPVASTVNLMQTFKFKIKTFIGIVINNKWYFALSYFLFFLKNAGLDQLDGLVLFLLLNGICLLFPS